MSYDSAFGQFMYNTFYGFDFGIFSFFGLIQNDIFTFFAKFVSTFGEPLFIYMFMPFCAVLCLFKKTRKIGFMLMAGVCAFYFFNNICIKELTQRLRPYNVLQGNSDYFSWYMNAGKVSETAFSFTSGHTCFTFCSATILFIWIKNDIKKSECWMIYIIPILTACSRIYLMVHYPTDVIAGMILGICIGIVTWYATKLLINILSKSQKLVELNKFDLQPIIEKKFNIKLKASKVTFLIVVIILLLMTIIFIKFSIFQAQNEHCSHNGPDYICLNKISSKKIDPFENGPEKYCEIHAKK